MSIVGNSELDLYQLQQLEGHIVLPPEIAAAIEANPHLLQPVVEVIRKAVQWSFNHPETRMRVTTGNEIQRRAQICLQIIEQAYAEQGFHLIQLKDALPMLLIEVLAQDKAGNDLLETEHQQGRWTAPDDGKPDIELTDDEEEELSRDLTEGVEPDPFSDEEFEEMNKK